MIDTHSHIDAEEFNLDRAEVIQRAKNSGVQAIFIPNINDETLPFVEKLAEQNLGYIFPMIGLHPEDVDPSKRNVDKVLDGMELRLHSKHPFVAIGEVGVDLYWDDTYRNLQIEVFERQVIWAAKYNLPLMIHTRNAFAEVVEVIARHYDKGLRGVFHCFTGTGEQALEFLKFKRFMLGVGGVLTFKKSKLPEVLKSVVPIDRIVLETDAPYMAPVPHRGKRNEPAFVAETIKFLADVYNMTPAQVEMQTNINVKDIFNVAI